MSSKRDILIAGAGPTGLSAAILLRLRGFDPIVVDRRPSLASLPSAHVVNTRSVEIFAEMGVADAVRAIGDPAAISSESGKVLWVESMAGREYGVLPIMGSAEDERGPLSAFCSVNIAQNRIEEILFERLRELGGDVRFGKELTGASKQANGARVSLRTVATGHEYALECDWLIGCDGAGSTVRRSLDIEMNGPRTLARFLTIYFRADLERYRKGRRALLYWIGGMDARGVLISFDRQGEIWAMLVPLGDLPADTFDDAAARAILRKAFGTETVPVELIGRSSWNMSAQVAKRFRDGAVLLAGDAAHRFPPTGGLGMNTGIQDAHNLAWKLAAVIEGRAPQALLDTYEQERRPIAQRNTDQSVHNLMKMSMIDEALGIATLAPVAANVADGPIAAYPQGSLRIDGDSPEAAATRAAVQHAIDAQAEHFAQGSGTDLGFSYAAGAIVPDGSPPPSDGPCHYRPDAHPGARLPFASADGGFATSTLGSVEPVGVTLFATDEHWAAIAAAVAGETGVPIAIRSLDEERFGESVRDLLGIEHGGAVAVRPDGHVLWRSRTCPDDPFSALEAAVRVSHARSRHA